jgi:tetratricopeptide (TPR) repeat protein
LKLTQNLSLLSLLVLLSSCSWLASMERQLVGEDEKPGKGTVARKDTRSSVTKAEYDELLSRYEELNRQYQALKDGRASDPLVTELRDAPMLTNQGVENGPRVETVDAFSGAAAASSEPVETGDVEGQLTRYRQAQAQRATSPSEAMKLFQELASSAVPPIRARAQLQMGEVLMQQGEFDLALQAFEGVINRMSYSGVVLDALRNAAVCSEKLGQTQKKTQYLSLLKDVFQIGV